MKSACRAKGATAPVKVLTGRECCVCVHVYIWGDLQIAICSQQPMQGDGRAPWDGARLKRRHEGAADRVGRLFGGALVGRRPRGGLFEGSKAWGKHSGRMRTAGRGGMQRE